MKSGGKADHLSPYYTLPLILSPPHQEKKNKKKKWHFKDFSSTLFIYKKKNIYILWYLTTWK